MSTKRLFLVRHGETDANLEHRIVGQTGSAQVTSQGRQEMTAAAAFLGQRLELPVKLWTSSQARASQSASLVGQQLGIQAITQVQELNQRNWGSAEGQQYAHAHGERTYLSDVGVDLVAADAEPLAAVRGRLERFLSEILDSAESDHLIVSHNELLNYLIDLAHGWKLKKRHILNGEVLLLEFDRAGKLQLGPRSLFPSRLILIRGVASFLRNESALKILADHDLMATDGDDPENAPKIVGILLGDQHFGIDDAAKYRQLRTVARYGTGVDNVDWAALHARRIWVTRTPGINTAEVADFATALITLLLRNILVNADKLRNPPYTWSSKLKGLGLREATVGIVGCGSIGFEVATLLQQRGTKVLVWNRTRRPHFEAAGFEPVADLHQLATCCDAISIHLARVPETESLIGASFFEAARLAKNTFALVSTARGRLVDEVALLQALNDGTVTAAAIDVWSAEGTESNEVTLRLRMHRSVLPTPHIASYTIGVSDRCAIQSARNLVALVEARPSEVQDALVKAQA